MIAEVDEPEFQFWKKLVHVPAANDGINTGPIKTPLMENCS